MKIASCVRLMFIGFGAVFLVGCTYFESGVPQSVTILSFPSEASVYINGEAIGISPIKTNLPRKMTHKIRLEKRGYNPLVQYVVPKDNEKADNFIRFGLSEDLGYYVDLEPRINRLKMQNDLLPASMGPNPFKRMTEIAAKADRQLETGQMSPLEHKYVIEETIRFFDSQK